MNRMKKISKTGVSGLIFFPALVLLFLFLLSLHMPWAQDHSAHQAQKTVSEKEEEKATVWTCAMHPQIQLPKPGKCPICGMDLIPVKTGKKKTGEMPGSLRELKLSPYAMKLAEIQTSPVERKSVSVHVRMVGKIEYDETRLGYITAWVPGRIDKLYVDFTGVSVHQGEPMVSLYSPQLMTAQSELIEAIRTANNLKRGKISSIKTTARQTITAAREKLRLLGLSGKQITEIIRRGRPSDHMTILSPMSGIVIRKNALEGMYVKTGTRIYTIADLSWVWAKLDAYESDIVWIRKGQKVEFQTEAYPGETFKGEITFIDPFINPKTRTVKVRVNVPNKDSKLKPEMFVHALVKAPISAAAKALVASPDEATKFPFVIPASAPLITGKRAVVYVAVSGQKGTFEGREIVLGPRAGDYYLVLSGLQEGERVVTNGNFKIDSSLQIQAKPSMMSPGGGGGGGHMQHGGMSMARKETGTKSPAMEIPAAFAHQIEKLLDAYRNISGSVQAGDLTEIRESFKKFGIALDSVNMNLLSGHPHMVWMELAMLMRNDSVIGGNAKDPEEAKEALFSLKKHMNRIRSQFNVSLSRAQQSKAHNHAGNSGDHSR